MLVYYLLLEITDQVARYQAQDHDGTVVGEFEIDLASGEVVTHTGAPGFVFGAASAARRDFRRYGQWRKRGMFASG